MKSKLFQTFVAVAVLGAVVFAGTGMAGARSAAKTTITIIPESDGVYGFIKSPRTQKCANNRKVVVFKQKGRKQKPGLDQKIGSDIAQPNGDGVEWNIGQPGHMNGKFYAHASRIPGCKPGNSRSVHMLPAN